MAVASLFRYGTRTGLTALGLVLAIAAVLFVNVVALSFESGTSSVYDFIRTMPGNTADVWITPPTGFLLDEQTGFFATQAILSESLSDQVFQANQSDGFKVLTGRLSSDSEQPLVIYGCSDCEAVLLNQTAAEMLNAKAGSSLTLNQQSLIVDRVGELPEIGETGLIQVPLAAAQQILEMPGQISWAMLKVTDSLALRQFFNEQVNIQVSTDPTATNASKQAIAYFLEERLSRADMVGFNVKLSAIYFNQAGSSLLGWLAKITLGLGFVLMLSAALLSIEERKREFGIYAAVGVSSDVFYLFFVESLLLFVGSTVIGLAVGALLLELLVPMLLDWGVVLKSSVLVICYLPPMVIFGSLVPAQQLLQKSPLDLIRSAA